MGPPKGPDFGLEKGFPTAGAAGFAASDISCSLFILAIASADIFGAAVTGSDGGVLVVTAIGALATASNSPRPESCP